MIKERILIAEDNDSVLVFTVLSVEMMGYETIKAVNGREAVEKVLIFNPDLVIIDWKMPLMDGLEATKILKENPKTRDIPIIMITGTDDASDFMAKAMEIGVNDYIRKPFNKIELHARIKSLLKQANYLKQIVEIKNEELNRIAIDLAYNIEFQKKIVSTLENINIDNTDSKTKINELINDVKIKEMLNPMNKLQNQFIEINTNFTTNLLSKHPNLTPAEIRLCMFLRLNLDTKEISTLSFQTYDSVRVARTRLREKLNIDSSENLVNYMMKF